jgi:hypothetical protein
MNNFGEDDTTTFQVAVIVSDKPEAIIDKLAATASSVEWYNSNPTEPAMLIMDPRIIGFSLPIRFMIKGVTLAKTKNMIINGS